MYVMTAAGIVDTLTKHVCPHAESVNQMINSVQMYKECEPEYRRIDFNRQL